MCICKFRYSWNSNGICGSWRLAKFTNSRLFALVSPRLRWSSRGLWHLANSGVLPRAGSSFTEDSPPVVQLFRDSRQLGAVSAFVASEDVLPQSPIGLCQFPCLSSPETIQKASLNWLSVSIMRGSTCKSWLELMGMLSSLTLHNPGVWLWMRSFQFALHRAWDRLDPVAFVRWSSAIRQNLFWWFDRKRLELVISLEQVSFQLDLWSNSSDVGW